MESKAKVLKILEDELAQAEAEVTRIKNAIAGYKGNLDGIETVTQTATRQPRVVPWKAEIEKIFESKNNLTIDDVKNQLIENGVKRAENAKGRSSITTTLTRMVKSGKLVANGDRFSKPATLTSTEGGKNYETSDPSNS